jgi:hypothetical protein
VEDFLIPVWVQCNHSFTRAWEKGFEIVCDKGFQYLEEGDLCFGVRGIPLLLAARLSQINQNGCSFCHNEVSISNRWDLFSSLSINNPLLVSKEKKNLSSWVNFRVFLSFLVSFHDVNQFVLMFDVGSDSKQRNRS